MFDLRYHVASLAAVFLALIIGILVGVAISDPALVDRTELDRQAIQISRLRDQLDAESRRTRQQEAAGEFVEAAYRAVMNGRLAGREIAVVFVGSVDNGLNDAVERALADAGAAVIRLRALKLPLEEAELESALAERASLGGYRGREHLGDLGRDLGRELVAGGETPLWDALGGALVAQRSGPAGPEAEGVVVLRSAEPQRGESARFLTGFYGGLEGAVPVVGAEASTSEKTAIPIFRRAGFSSVDAIDTRVGKVALAVLLEGRASGHFGLSQDRVLPRIEPVEPEPEADTGG